MVVKIFINCMQLQGFLIDSHTFPWVRHMIESSISHMRIHISATSHARTYIRYCNSCVLCLNVQGFYTGKTTSLVCCRWHCYSCCALITIQTATNSWYFLVQLCTMVIFYITMQTLLACLDKVHSTDTNYLQVQNTKFRVFCGFNDHRTHTLHES